MTRIGIEPDTGLKRVVELSFMIRNGIGRDMRKLANDTTKTGIEPGNTRVFTKDAPVEGGYYWIKRFINGQLLIEPAYVFENEKLSWGNYWKIKFIGDTHAYSLVMAEQQFELLYGGKCL